MKLLVIRIVLIGSLFILAACQTPVAIDFDRSQIERMQAFDTFEIDTREEREGYGNISLSPLVDRRVENAIRNHLEDKGYARSESADFRVNFHTITKDRTSVHDLGYGPAPFGREPYFGDYSYGRLFIEKYEEGTLVIDIIDKKSNQLLWRGAHTRRLERTALSPLHAQAVVDAILLNFPPIRAGALN